MTRVTSTSTNLNSIELHELLTIHFTWFTSRILMAQVDRKQRKYTLLSSGLVSLITRVAKRQVQQTVAPVGLSPEVIAKRTKRHLDELEV